MNRLKKNIGKHSICNSLKKSKYLRINLTKGMNNLYKETYNLFFYVDLCLLFIVSELICYNNELSEALLSA
jgi:hypothetical protein